MRSKFHHAHLICQDLENMISFFTETFDAQLLARKKFGTADGASLDLDGTVVNLRVAREDETMAGDASQTRYGFDHIGIEVKALEAAVDQLKSKGYEFFIDPRDAGDVRIAFFKGPENITIELLQSIAP